MAPASIRVSIKTSNPDRSNRHLRFALGVAKFLDRAADVFNDCDPSVRDLFNSQCAARTQRLTIPYGTTRQCRESVLQLDARSGFVVSHHRAAAPLFNSASQLMIIASDGGAVSGLVTMRNRLPSRLGW